MYSDPFMPAPTCAELSVDMHDYSVIVRWVDDGEIMSQMTIRAGDRAQACLLMGMAIAARLVLADLSEETNVTFMHNITNHVTVEATLVV